MKKRFLFSLLAIILAGLWLGGVSLADLTTECTSNDAVAKIEWATPVCYQTLSAAFNAVGYSYTIPETATTIILLKDSQWNWLATYSAQWVKNIIVDFWWHTYSIWWELVWSVWTVSQAFHFEKWSKIVLKNWTITSTNASMLVQNYCDLTIEDLIVDWSTLQWTAPYTMSNNFWSLTV